jgi:hypothetical protein
MQSTMFIKRSLVILSFAAAAGHALAAPPAAADDKQKLIQRVLQLWHPEDTAIMMVQRPAIDAMQQARIALQGRVSAQKQEATLKDISTDIQKYVDEALPIAKGNAEKLKAPTLAPMLAQNFNEDELRQLIALLESPIKKKFEALVPQLERGFGEKIASESRAAIDPKLQAMTQAVGLKLRGATMTP